MVFPKIVCMNDKAKGVKPVRKMVRVVTPRPSGCGCSRLNTPIKWPIR